MAKNKENHDNKADIASQDTVRQGLDSIRNSVSSLPSQSSEGNSVSDAGNAQVKEDINQYIEQLQRLQAEFENFKKREDREKARFVDFAKAGIILKLLNFNDDFQRTLASLNNADIGVVKKGVEMLATNFQKLLKEEGVEHISCVGNKLDPYKHEVLLQEEADKEDGVILEELQKGYMLKGNVLRPSRVKVCKCVSPLANSGGVITSLKKDNAPSVLDSCGAKTDYSNGGN